MEKETISYIKKLADVLRFACGIDGSMCSMENYVRTLGGRVKEEPGIDLFYDSGVRKTGEKSFVLLLPPHMPEKEQTFAQASELGHLFLHMGYLIDEKQWEKQPCGKAGPLSDTMREQAFEFAMALLLPREEFEKALLNASDKNFADISEVSKHFNVSVSLALKRGRDLGYIA